MHKTMHPVPTMTLSCSLPEGLGCRYKSEKSGWLNCRIVRFHPSDGTYDLDVRQRASAEKIAPHQEVDSVGSCSWPVGSLVSYHSRSQNIWLPTEILSFNAADATYNLGVCEHAHPDRIRARSVSGMQTWAHLGMKHMSAGMAKSLPQNKNAASSRVPLTKTALASLGMKQAALASFGMKQVSASAAQSLPQNKMPPLPVLLPSMPEIQQVASIETIIHPGHDPRADEELAAVIVTISTGPSYDQLFSQVPQLAGEGKRVATYAVSAESLQYIAGQLSGVPVQSSLSAPLRRSLRRLIGDVQAVPPDSVVFNWECCAGCCQEHFHNSAVVMDLVKLLLGRGHMVMFSDFSLKALIKDWKEDLLGPNPFVKVTEFGGKFKLRFDPAALKSCPSAQLQKLGELAGDGKAELHAMMNTIAFSVQRQKADRSFYNCEVLTVMTELDDQPACPPQGLACKLGSHQGLAGHVLLTYPSGGRLLASAGHWIELSRLNVNEADLLQAAGSFGIAFQREVQTSISACATDAERRKAVQSFASQMVQQSAPCSMSRVAPSRKIVMSAA